MACLTCTSGVKGLISKFTFVRFRCSSCVLRAFFQVFQFSSQSKDVLLADWHLKVVCSVSV